jgi:hypothetical protein
VVSQRYARKEAFCCHERKKRTVHSRIGRKSRVKSFSKLTFEEFAEERHFSNYFGRAGGSRLSIRLILIKRIRVVVPPRSRVSRFSIELQFEILQMSFTAVKSQKSRDPRFGPVFRTSYTHRRIIAHSSKTSIQLKLFNCLATSPNRNDITRFDDENAFLINLLLILYSYCEYSFWCRNIVRQKERYYCENFLNLSHASGIIASSNVTCDFHILYVYSIQCYTPFIEYCENTTNFFSTINWWLTYT